MSAPKSLFSGLKNSLLFLGLLFLSLTFIWFLQNRSILFSSSRNAARDLNPPTPPQDILEQIFKLKSQPVQNEFSSRFPVSPLTNAGPFKVPILMYHYVEYVADKKDTIRQSLNINPYTFEEQIKTLVSANYTFLTVGELADILNERRDMPLKPILLTFDDGYRDFYTDAYPILKKYHVKATEYVVSGFLDRPNYMYSRQIQEIAKNGLVEIGAHTVHHLWLKGEHFARADQEIVQSKIMLEKLTKLPVVSFAYPYGAFDSQTVSMVKDAGFTSAVSTLPGIIQGQENKFYLFRLRPGAKTGETFLEWLRQESHPPGK